MNNEQIKVLNKIYSMSQDTHNILTPISICDEMINSLNIKDNKSILVVSNMEFLISLRKHNIDMKNVHYTVNCPIKKQFAENIGIQLNNIHNLEYNNKEINFGTEEDMKFDYIVMNPPYNEGLLTPEYKANINNLYSGDLVKKAIIKRIDSTFIIHSYEKLLKDGGELTAVWPIKWMQLSSWQNFRNWNNSVGLTSFKILPRNTFKDVDINVGITRYTKTEHISDTFLYENKEFSQLVQKTNNILPLLDNKIEESIFNKIKTHKQLIKLDRKKTTTYALGTSSAIASEDDININSSGLGASSAMGPLRINKPGKFYINCNNELEYNNWINFYYSPFASFYVFMYSVDWNASLLNIGMLPDINIIFKNKEYNKKELYNYFKFTTEEIKYLENKAMLYFKVDGIENKKRAEKKH